MADLTPEKFGTFVKRIAEGRVFVVPDPLVQQRMMGGLFLPDSSTEEKKSLSPFRSGRVIGVGPGCKAEVGDRVVYHERMDRNRMFIGGDKFSASFIDIGDGDITCWLQEDAQLVQQVIKPAGLPG